jgi:hypothetical protein
MSRPSIDVVRPLALALPEVVESQHFGTPDFRVRGKIFTTARHAEALCMMKLPPHIQEAMVTSRPDVFSLPPGGWAKHGATYANTDKIDLDLLKDLLDLAWRRAAPKKLAAAHETGPEQTRRED